MIASKFGFDMIRDGQIRGLNSQPAQSNEPPKARFDGLKTDRIDLHYQHRVDPTVPIEDVAGAVKELIKARQGPALWPLRSRWSNDSPGTRSAAGHRRAERIFALVAGSRTRSPPDVPATRHRLRAVESARDGLSHGSGHRRHGLRSGDLRAGFPRFTQEARRANWPVVELLQRVARRKNATPAQVALAWLLARHPSIVPIPGTTKLRHFEENQGALDVSMSTEDLRELEDGLAKIQVQGARTTEQLLQMTDIGARFGTSSRGGHGVSPLPTKR